jgi:hypothetical protein
MVASIPVADRSQSHTKTQNYILEVTTMFSSISVSYNKNLIFIVEKLLSSQEYQLEEWVHISIQTIYSKIQKQQKY